MCATCWTACPFISCVGSDQKSLPAVHAAGIHTIGDLRSGRAMRSCGAPSASMANRCEPWHSGIDDRPVDRGSGGEIDQCGGDVRRRPSGPRGTQAATGWTRGPRRVALAGSRPRRGSSNGQDSTRGFHDVHAAAQAGAADPRHRRDIRHRAGFIARMVGPQPRCRSAITGGWRRRPADRSPGRSVLLAACLRDSRLDATIDGIRDRFGSSVLTRASLLPRPPDGTASRRG